ncbi:MAG: hypothetical protein J6S75_07915, partial [Thermoguttaceae bacterium]|nr:hypothetical protein [Thermoguttaceae bacterium]
MLPAVRLRPARPESSACPQTGRAVGSYESRSPLRADRHLRIDDPLTPGGKAGKRPDRAALAYAHRARQA